MTANETVDLASFDALVKAQEEGVEFELKNPVSGKGIGAFITLAGPDSARHRAAWRVVWDARASEERLEATAEDSAADTSRLLANVVISWRGVLVDGAEMTFSVDNAIALFKRFPFIREQIDRYAGRRANFSKA